MIFPPLSRALAILVLSLLSVACSEKSTSPAPDTAVQREAGDFLTRDVAAYRKRVISQPEYTINIDLDRAPGIYDGEVTASFNYAGGAQPLTVDFVGGEVMRVALNGADVTFDYNNYFITVPTDGIEPGKLSLLIEYEQPFSQDGAGLYRYEDPEDGRVYLYTDFEPYDANRLFPHFDQPDLKARYTLTVRAPAAWQVISTTRETSIAEAEDHRIRCPAPWQSSS